MYTSIDLFREHYELACEIEQERIRDIGLPDIRGTVGNINASVDKAWRLYENAQNPTLRLTLFGRFSQANGGWIDTSPRVVKPASGPTILNPCKKRSAKQTAPGWIEHNFGFVDGRIAQPDGSGGPGGSVQHMPASEFNLHVNDAWLLGGVHKYLPFYAASKLSEENMFRNKYRRLGITGRELFCLLLAGYRPVTNPKLGTVMTCRDRQQADALNLVNIEAEIDDLERKHRNGTSELTKMARAAGIELY
ncbi:hypothetical protein FKG94_06385 [Exilibacterium tricleocarpae]|uniref:Uncharacterized protein n=1 Tax=Exilibacterium tricleocarpae TaxID=2591008 RepID=A0A545U465_9GAMM|nr:hypothetical protein [Exilibacterium tricleocarpae]TQV84281.1 hypothetical protein FKG94_06385 [Exilibacterium tricleocarpae]